MRSFLVLALLAVVLVGAWMVFDVQVNDPGALPDINVSVEDPDRLPDVDVNTRDVDVTTEERTVEVPKVEVE